ncbi:hypothetical protein SASPL_147763 [Salvia splendens]|uniref:JAB1/MPN/MOV34 metalloenzyme domain-containing protein n=1 Tax=Salvia splendens TaxID=180675 RepID=A0A8X8WF24_SALSN|nr:hypothetical protein SASPL_147763 [Salvia splendens]
MCKFQVKANCKFRCVKNLSDLVTMSPMIRECFAKPSGTIYRETSYVALDIDYHQNMLTSHQKVNPKEAIVGWIGFQLVE